MNITHYIRYPFGKLVEVFYSTMVDNATPTVITAIDTPVKVAGMYVEQYSTTGFSIADNTITFKDGYLRHYKIDIAASLTAGSNNVLGVMIVKNGTVLDYTRIHSTNDVNGRSENINTTAIIPIDNNDFIEVFVENETSTADIIAEDLIITIFSID